MITAQDIISQIEGFMDRTGLSASAFGRQAIGDPNLVGDLRDGRMPNLRTLGRLNDFMESYPENPTSSQKEDAA